MKWLFKKTKPDLEPPTVAPLASPAEIYEGLRRLALDSKPKELGITIDSDTPFVVLMETGYAKAVATLVAVADGSASLYFSNGGGIIGLGHKYEFVRRASILLIQNSASFLPLMKHSTEQLLPEIGKVTFYVITPKHILTCGASENELGMQQSPLSPLFYSAQNLITQMRQSSEQKQ